MRVTKDFLRQRVSTINQFLIADKLQYEIEFRKYEKTVCQLSHNNGRSVTTMWITLRDMDILLDGMFGLLYEICPGEMKIKKWQ